MKSKVQFDYSSDGTRNHLYPVEALWAQPLGDDLYRLENIPFSSFDVSYEDVVVARPGNGIAIFEKVAEHSGHSTIRLFLRDGIDNKHDERFVRLKNSLEAIGATLENGNNIVYALDVPPTTNLKDINKLLQTGAQQGLWDVEDGFIAHTS